MSTECFPRPQNYDSRRNMQASLLHFIRSPQKIAVLITHAYLGRGDLGGKVTIAACIIISQLRERYVVRGRHACPSRYLNPWGAKERVREKMRPIFRHTARKLLIVGRPQRANSLCGGKERRKQAASCANKYLARKNKRNERVFFPRLNWVFVFAGETESFFFSFLRPPTVCWENNCDWRQIFSQSIHPAHTEAKCWFSIEINVGGVFLYGVPNRFVSPISRWLKCVVWRKEKRCHKTDGRRERLWTFSGLPILPQGS